PRVQRWPDDLVDVLGPVGSHQQSFGPGSRGGVVGVEQEVAKGPAEVGGAGLVGEDGPEALGQPTGLGGLAAAVDALQGDQPAPAGRRFVARATLCHCAPLGRCHCAPLGRCHCAPLGRGHSAFFLAAARLAGAFLAAAFLVVAFLATPAFLAGAFLAPPALRLVDGPAARRSANSSAARSMVMCSTSSPLRREALVVPSVTYGPNRPSRRTTGRPVSGSAPSSFSGAAGVPRPRRVLGWANNALASSMVTVSSWSSLARLRLSVPRLR